MSLAVARPLVALRLRLTRAERGDAIAGSHGFLRRAAVRFKAPALDARLAVGEDPAEDVALACRSLQLTSTRSRRGLAAGLERALSTPVVHAAFSAAVPANRRAVALGRPALQQLASALRSRDSVEPRGVALVQVLLTEPDSALFRPAYPEQLYEAARNALFALGPDGAAPLSREKFPR